MKQKLDFSLNKKLKIPLGERLANYPSKCIGMTQGATRRNMYLNFSTRLIL